MTRFSAIRLSELPPPPVIEPLDYETALAVLKQDLINHNAELAEVLNLESRSVRKVLEACAHRETALRQRINDAARGVMLASAQGGDLDHLAAFFGVERQTLTPGDPQARPARLPVYEDDERLRQRTQLSLEGYTTAGPVGSYVFWSLSASPNVKDVHIASPTPGRVVVTVLSMQGDGVPDADLLALVDARLSAKDVRPLTDQVTVQAATIRQYSVQARLVLHDGLDAAVVRNAATAGLNTYVEARHRLGESITQSGIDAALNVAGVRTITLIGWRDIETASNEAPKMTGATLTIEEAS